MAEQAKEANVLSEVVREVVITPEDVAGAAEFWTQFDIPMPEELKAAFDNFMKNPTVENQDKVKLYITKAIAQTDHEALNDEMFTEIREECRTVTYDMSFDDSLEKHLTKEE